MNLASGFKRSAVGALNYSGIFLVSYDLDFGKRAVVFTSAVMGALRHGAADRLVSGVTSTLASAGVFKFVHFRTDTFRFFVCLKKPFSASIRVFANLNFICVHLK